MEIVQHRLDRDMSGMEGSRRELEQKLREEKEASESILNYLQKHYNVSSLSTSLTLCKIQVDRGLQSCA